MDSLAPDPPNDPGKTIVRVGVDIGKQQDFTALIVTEEVRRMDIPHYLVRSIERLPLGTPYPAVVDRVAKIMDALETRSRRHPPRGASKNWRLFDTELVIDATGVGLAVADLIKERGLYPKVALFTGSDKLTSHPSNVIHVGKGWMVSRLQVLLQARRLKLPMGHETELLIKELQAYEVSISQSGHASFNARSGSHDDLVIALGLSVGTGGDTRMETFDYLEAEPPLGTREEHRQLSTRHR